MNKYDLNHEWSLIPGRVPESPWYNELPIYYKTSGHVIFYRKFGGFKGWVIGERDVSDPASYAEDGGYKIVAKMPSPDLAFGDGELAKCPCDVRDTRDSETERSDWTLKYQNTWVARSQLGIGTIGVT